MLSHYFFAIPSQLIKKYDSHCMQMCHFEEIHSKWVLLDLHAYVNSKWCLWPSSICWHALVVGCTFVLYLLFLTCKNTMPLTSPPPTCVWFAFTNLSVVSLHDTFLLNSCKFQASYILLTFLWMCMVLSFVNSKKIACHSHYSKSAWCFGVYSSVKKGWPLKEDRKCRINMQLYQNVVWY